MSRVGEIKRQLEVERVAIEALDEDLRAGRLSADEHALQRAEREREAGRLFVILRQTQRETRGPEAEPPEAPTPTAPPWFRTPLLMVPAALVLIALGIGGGVLVGNWSTGGGGGAVPAGAPPAGPGGAPSQIELQALRAAASREDAPIEVLLQFAHVALDQGRAGEAQRVYERVLARDPRNVEAINHLGAVLFQEGNVEGALGKVEEALRIDPQYVHALWDRVQYQKARRDFPATIKAGEAFLAVLPQGPDADNIRKIMADARQQVGQAKP